MMAVDYDAPRQANDEPPDTSQYVARIREEAARDGADVEEPDEVESFELPGADLPGEDIVPQRADEFICASCFLVYHRSQLTAGESQQLCRDCA